jgi:hypothetical protein
MVTISTDEKPQEGLNVFEMMREVSFTDFKYKINSNLKWNWF